jgi:hypothetical protein
MIACASNIQGTKEERAQAVGQVEKLVDKTEGEVERTYEFFFNYSQLLMKKQLYLDAFRTLVKSYDLAKQDEDSLHGDLARFKAQELHTLNTFALGFSSISYNAGGAASGARFRLPRSLKHDNIVEVNMSAQGETGAFEHIDREYFKELIGNLNWNKFSERI